MDKVAKEFAEWKSAVNHFVLAATGLDTDALPDYDYWKDFNKNVRPGLTAKRVIRAAKGQ